MGKDGISIVITYLREKYAVKKIEDNLHIRFERMKIPTGKEICEKQLFNLVDKMEHVQMDNEAIDDFLPVIYKKLDWMSKEEVIKRFVSMEFNRFLDYYQDADELNEPVEQRERGRGRDKERQPRQSDGNAEKGYTRLFISVGKMDGLVPAGLIEHINRNMPTVKVPVGRIDLLEKFSFFEVKSTYAQQVVEQLNNTRYRGSRIDISLAQGKEAVRGKDGGAGNKKSYAPRFDRRSDKPKKRRY